MFFPRPRVHTQMLPPRIHPTQHNVKYNCCEYLVPEVHPSHTTIVNRHMYKHFHNFPHTQSVVDQVSNQHFMCPGQAPFMGPGPGRRWF